MPFVARIYSLLIALFFVQGLFVMLPQAASAITAEDCEMLGDPSDVQACLDSLGAQDTSIDQNPIYLRLNQVINFLSIGVTVAVTLSVVVAGIQWAVSGGEPQKKAAAVNRLWNSAIAILVFVFGWTILNWLVPGGVLN